MMMTPSKKAKIKWNCRRGMLELDLILNRFMDQQFDQLSAEQHSIFEQLLNHSDPQLYLWLTGQDDPADKELAKIVAMLRAC